MSVLQKLIGALLRPRVKGKARGATFDTLAKRLESSRDELLPRLRSAKDTPANREAINHFVGIERWSQSRLRVGRGAPFQLDAYHGYRLPEDATLDELQRAFAATREETIAMARDFDAAGVDPQTKVRHNDLGELSLLEWFAYVDDHHRRERLRVKV